MPKHSRVSVVLLCVLLCCGLLQACGGGAWYNPFSWGDPPGTAAGHAGGGGSGGVADPTGLISIFGWWSWACIAIGVLATLASFVFPIVPTRASASAIVLGIALGIAKGFIVKYAWLLYVCAAVGGIAVAWPALEAGRRWITARATGQPIEGHTGLEAVRKLIPIPRRQSNAGKVPIARGDSGGPVVRAASPRPDSHGSE